MNSSKIACDFLTSKLKLEILAEQNNITKADCFHALFVFCKTHPQSSLLPKIRRKLKANIAASFLSYGGARDKFAAEYGMSEHKLISIIYEVVDDHSLLPNDTAADRLFRKLTQGRVFCVASMPKRIVNIIGKYYTNSPISQSALAKSYGINDFSISTILRRGIADGIFDEELANKVYAKVRDCKYMTKSTMKAYNAAFDKRMALQDES